MIGVTPVPRGSVVCCPMAANVTQAWLPWPSGHHGAKWSDAPRPSKPARSAARACSSIWEGGNSSVEAANQNWVMPSGLPGCGRRLCRELEQRSRGTVLGVLRHGPYQGHDDLRVELVAGAALELGHRVGDGQRRPVGAVRGHRAVGVARADDARGERDGLARDAVGVAVAVPALVVV